ncbi:MAG TPA: hypothetical protein VHL78_04600 [Actinomycetota bacterium]|nr:hypothetical protein [Actinomycetota bacterium]
MSQQPPPGQPPYGPPPQYPTTPAYGAPPPPPPRRGVSGGVIAAILGGVGLLVAGAVAFLLLRGGEETVPPPPPPPPPVTPSPTVAPSPSPIETASPDAPPPDTQQATLQDLLLPQVGNFRLIRVDADPQAISELGAVDAIAALYTRADNTQMIHLLQAYPTNFDADRVRNAFVQALRNQGYRTVGELRERGVRATRLVANDEVVVWSNGPIVAILEGPFDTTVGFFLVLPY